MSLIIVMKMFLLERRKLKGIAMLTFAVGLDAGIICKDSYLPDFSSRVI